MAKKGMKRYFPETEKNNVKPVPELGGKVKSGKEKAKPLSSAYMGYSQNSIRKDIFPFSKDSDLTAIENIANDLGLTAADMQDFRG